MARIRDIAHASIIVGDIQRAVHFYRDVLGLDLIRERPDLAFDGAWFRVGDRQLHLLVVPNPDPTEGRPDHGGRDRHLAFDVDGLTALQERLEASGIPYTVSRSGRKALFCRDPDANAVELIESSG